MSDRPHRPDPHEMMARFEGLQEQMSAANVEVFSEDGLVAVRLDGNGRVKEIKIDEYAMRKRQTLAPTIIALVDQARIAYAEKSAELARQFLNADPALSALLDRISPERPS
jgi:DNA-binding protein YbaB